MARSRRKTPIIGNCCGSDTRDRQHGNRALRRACRIALAMLLDPDDLVLPAPGEIHGTDPWDWTQDGRSWVGDWLKRFSPVDQIRRFWTK